MTTHTAAAKPRARQDDALQGTRWLAGGSVAVAIVNYLTTFFLLRNLADDDIAVNASAQALLQVVGSVAGACAAWAVVEVVASASTDRAAALRRSRRAALLGGLLAALVLAVAATSFAPATATAVVAAATLATVVASWSYGVLQADGRFVALTVTRIAEVVVRCGVAVAATCWGAGATGTLSGALAGSALVVAVGVLAGRRSPCAPVPLSTGGIPSRSGLVAAVALQGLVAVLAALDQVLVSVLPGDRADVAAYQTCLVLSRVPVVVAAAAAATVYPVLREGTGGAAVMRRFVGLYGVCAGAVVAVLASVPLPVLEVFFPGRAASLRPLLAPTAVSGAMLGVLVLAAAGAQAWRRSKPAGVVIGAGAIVLATAVELGHARAGVTGVAYATAAVTVLLVIALLATSSAWRRVSVRPLALATLGAAGLTVLLSLPAGPPAWSVGTGVAAVAVALVVVRGTAAGSCP